MASPKTTPSIEFKSAGFTRGGKPFFLYSGEIHYFRIPKTQWRSRLRALKGAGLNTVSFYIPWIWHEPEEGRFDFTGETVPERDVRGFMDLAKAEGLNVMARVGPVSNAELRHEGLPDWLVKKYPEIFVTGRRNVGNLPHVTIISYLHPVFQEKVGRWFDALLPLVAARQPAQGGNVIGVQLCNEVAMVHWLQKGSDHKEHVNKMYREFLREKYKSIAALNQEHKTSLKGFEEAEQPATEETTPERLAVFMDWSLFYRRYYATYFKLLADKARGHGVSVPLYCNIPQFYDYDVRGRGNWAPMTTSMFRDFSLLTPGLVFGGAYQMRHLDYENFHDVALTTEVTRLLTTAQGRGTPPLDAFDTLPPTPDHDVTAVSDVPVVCAELQTGIMRDRPKLYPHQVLLNLKSSTAQGLAGVNAYMFAGGVNPPGLGAFGTYHDWQAPVGPQGEIRPHYAPMKDFGRLLSWAGPLLAQTRKAVDTTLGFYLPTYATEYWKGPWNDSLEGDRTNLWYDGLARLLHVAGYACDMVDLQRTPIDVLLQKPHIWAYCLDFMDKPTQEKLADYVERGGKLVMYPRLPTQDLAGRKETTLIDRLGISLDKVPGNIFPHNGEEFWIQGPIQIVRKESGGTALVPGPQGAPIHFKKAGEGAILSVGVGLPHVFDHYKDWVRQWAGLLGIQRTVECGPWDVQAVLRRNEDHGFLFLFNYHFNGREASLTLNGAPGHQRPLRLPSKGKIRLEPFSAAVLPINLPLANGDRLLYATAEPRKISATKKSITVELDTLPGGPVEMAVRSQGRMKTVKVNGKKISPINKSGSTTVTFTATDKKSLVSITLG